jgi:glycosyltransferase involved in cell wall biosynthesis
VKIAWVHYPLLDPPTIPELAGIAKGYQQSAYFLYTALQERLGGDLVNAPITGSHPVVHLHYCPPHMFRPVPNRKNVLFTMWESPVLPAWMTAPLRLASLCLVPSSFCAEVWASGAGVRAEVVPLGLHEGFLATDPGRHLLRGTGRKLRFLWVGSRIARKGWDRLAPAWAKAFTGQFDVQLTIKTIGQEKDVQEWKDGSVVLDRRNLNLAELVELYLDHDVFVCCSHGEGFGLPALEAMATGCLYLGTSATGLSEFVGPTTAAVIPLRQQSIARYGGQAFALQTMSVDDLAAGLVGVHSKWGSPISEAIRHRGTQKAREFTWGRAAGRLIDVVTHAAMPTFSSQTQRSLSKEVPSGVQ